MNRTIFVYFVTLPNPEQEASCDTYTHKLWHQLFCAVLDHALAG